MSDAKFRIHTEDGNTHQAQAPLELTAEDFIDEIVAGLRLSSGGDDNSTWGLYSKESGTFLNPNVTLGQNGLRLGQDLYLSRRRNASRICPSCRAENPSSSNFCQRCGKSLASNQASSDLRIHVHVPNGTVHSAEVPSSLTVKEFIADLINTLGYLVKTAKGGEIRWKLDDKDTGKPLIEDRTFAENGVLSGRHLYLRPYEQTAPEVKRRRPIPLPVIAAGLGVFVLLGMGAIFIPRISGRSHPNRQLRIQLPSTATPTASSTATPVPITVQVEPRTVTLRVSQRRAFQANVNGNSNHTVQWSVAPAVGSISADGIYQAPASLQRAQPVKVIATSKADPQVSGSAFITLKPAAAPAVPVSVSVIPIHATVSPGHQEQFIAQLAGSTNRNVLWSRSPDLGSISADGVYQAPSSVPVEETIKITAISKADPHKSSSVVLTLLSNVLVQVDPASTTLASGKKQKFKANVTGTNNKTVAWSIRPEVGAISDKGEYKAPSPVSTEQTVQIIATSMADPHKFASAVVTLKPKR